MSKGTPFKKGLIKVDVGETASLPQCCQVEDDEDMYSRLRQCPHLLSCDRRRPVPSKVRVVVKDG